MGPMTGRGAGYCGGNDQPGFVTAPGGGGGMGRGMGRGRGGWGRGQRSRRGFGGGMGRGQGGIAPPPPVNRPADVEPEELELLREQAANLEQALLGLKQRIDELEPPSETKDAGSEKD